MYTVLAPCRFTTKMERTECSPWGLRGGQAGQTGSIEVIRHTGEVLHLAKDETTLEAGDRVRVCSGGGGGYGPPWTRALDRVADDLDQGYITANGAEHDYGVVLDSKGSIDATATANRREQMAQSAA
jgi:N-methylhydantoinase B